MKEAMKEMKKHMKEMEKKEKEKEKTPSHESMEYPAWMKKRRKRRR